MMKAKAYAVLALLIWMGVVNASTPTPYDEYSDPNAEFVSALAEAHSSGKKVLIIFGSNWCSDCISFDRRLQQEPLKSLIKKEFVIIKTDIGNWDKNMDFAERFGNPAKSGIPSIAVVATDKNQYYAAGGSELARARHQTTVDLTEWLTLLGSGAR